MRLQDGLAVDRRPTTIQNQKTPGHCPPGRKCSIIRLRANRLGEEVITAQVQHDASQANIALQMAHSQRKHQFRLHEQIMFDIKIENRGTSSFSYAPDIFGKGGLLVATLFKGDKKTVVKQRVGPVIVAGLPLHGNIEIKPDGISHQPIFVDSLFHADTPGNYTLVVALRKNRSISVSYNFTVTADHA
jgi:hypothetical protein